MLLRIVLWWISSIIIVNCTLDFRYLTQRRHYLPPSQDHCYGFPDYSSGRIGKAFKEDWRSRKKMTSSIHTSPASISRRFDLLPGSEDIIKEHAKLVQDINGLRQIVFVAPLIEDNRDYDDSIFHESIETFTTSTSKPTLMKTYKSTKPGIPVIFLGGASQQQTVRSQPTKYPKLETINLVGTSVSPFVKHPYPFVVQGASNKPLKFCMTSLPTMNTSTRRPSLWERLLNSIIPRQSNLNLF